MRKLQTILSATALGLGLLAPAFAQGAAQPMVPPAPDAQGMPASPATQQPQSDMAGQSVYNAKGREIGTVQAMTTDTDGQPGAVVKVERYLGIGGKNVVFPVSSLSQRAKGGYTTSLTASQIKALPEATAAGAPRSE